MIASLKGQVNEISGTVVTLDVSGVGYEVICTRDCVATLEIGRELSVVIYTEVKEDSIRLFGFADKLEKQMFLMLIVVKGVGARTASEILSRVDKRELLRIIAVGDVGGLQSIKGIGKKTAERIVVELKDKVAEYVLGTQGVRLGLERIADRPLEDAVAALAALGFSRAEAEQAVMKAQKAGDLDGGDAGQIVKEALRFV